MTTHMIWRGKEFFCFRLRRKGQRGKNGEGRTARKILLGKEGTDGEERTARKGRKRQRGKEGEVRIARMVSKIFLDWQGRYKPI